MIAIFLPALVLAGCRQGVQTSPPDYMPGKLIFQSGFEAASTIPYQDAEGTDINGRDESVPPPNDWEKDLEEHPNIGHFRIQYQGGDSSQRLASIIEDPTRPGNHVLQYWMHRPNVGTEKAYGGKFRIQANFYENEGLHEIYYKVRVYFSRDWQILRNWEESMRWFILAEYWNNGGWTGEDHVFRMHLTLNKDGGTGKPLYFGIGAQVRTDGWKELWHEENKEFPIPTEEWLCLEIHLREGDGENGRYWLQVTDSSGRQTVVFDITDYTHHPDDPVPDGYRHLNPLKTYSHRDNINYVTDAGGTLQVLWDDLQVFEGLELVK